MYRQLTIKYSVLVSNIGVVYEGYKLHLAEDEYNLHVDANKTVTLISSDSWAQPKVLKEYVGKCRNCVEKA